VSYTSEQLLNLIREMLSYDPKTGEIRWIKSPAKNVYAGELAGCVKATRRNSQGNNVSYRYIRLDGMNIPAQRIAYALHHGEFPSARISFNDGDPLNLKADNLGVQRAAIAHVWEKENRAEYFRAHRKEFSLSYSEMDMRRKYGIGLHEYSQMLLSQNGQCAICGTMDAGTRDGKAKAFAIDHDHKTGKVRALLCESCNTGLGKFKDDVTILLKAADYLRLHSIPGNPDHTDSPG